MNVTGADLVEQNGPAPSRMATPTTTRLATDAEAISSLVNAAFKVERFFMDRDRINPDLETGTEPFATNATPSQPCHFIKMSKHL
jgi:hypothetical protein